MRLAGVSSQNLNESSRIDFLKKDFEDRVSRKYDKFLKFYSRGSWNQENEPDGFIKNIVFNTALENGEIIPKDNWMKNMMTRFSDLEKADPTDNKQYLNWLINIYLSGNLLDEDIYKANEELSLFFKNKEKIPLEQRNINSYTDLQSLSSVLQKYSSEEEMSSTEKQKIIKLEGAEQVYDSPNWKIIIPKTEEAACLYGKSTKWCTASSAHNRFSYYSQQGPLFILINKKIGNDRDNLKKLQFHFETNQFMDTLDRQIGITQFFKSNPELIDFFKKEGKIDAAFQIEHMLVSKKEGLKLLKTLDNKVSLIKNKNYSFFERFYKEIGATKEFVDIILNDKEFIKKIFENGYFSELIHSYNEMGLKKEGLDIIKSLPWLNDWFFDIGTSPETIQRFVQSIKENLGPKGLEYIKELLKPTGVLWNALTQPNKNKISYYFSMLSNSNILGSEGLKLAKNILNNKNMIDDLKSRGVTRTTLEMLKNFYYMKKECFQAQLYLRNILSH